MRLFSFNSLANEAGKSQELPKRIKVFNWGINKTLKGDVVVNEKTAKVFNANQKAMGRDVIPLDYEHNTVPGTTAYKESKEPRPVAAHLVPEIVVGDGVYLSVSDWTDTGKEYAKNYKDLSPAPFTDEDNTLIGLHSVALTQTGAVFDLTFLNTAGSPVGEDLVTLSAAMGIQVPEAYKLALQKARPDFSPKANDMKENLDYDEDGKKKSIKVMRKAMAMGDEKSDEEVLKCMSEAIESGKWVRKGPLDTAGGTSDKIATYNMEAIADIINKAVELKLQPLSADVKTLAQTALDAQKAAEETERNSLVAAASRDAKVIPLSSETLKTFPVAALREMIAALPKTLNFDRSPMARIKAGEKGKINGSASRQVTMTVGGVPVTLNMDGQSQEAPQPRGLARAAAGFQAQYDAATSN